MSNKGGNYKTLKERLNEDNIDYLHIKQCNNSNKNRKLNRTKISLSEVLIENSTYNRTNLKQRIIKENLLEYKCAICGIENIWNNKPLVLILDHINGVSNDHRLENLRFLCPNCNSQTDTFAGKNNTNMKKEYIINREKCCCKDCGKEITRYSKSGFCNECYYKSKSRIPLKEELQKLILNNTYSAIGKMFNVSVNAVKKWCKKYNLNKNNIAC